MRKLRKKLSLLLLTAVTVVTVLPLTGCHGSRGMDAFVIPEEFDYEKIDAWKCCGGAGSL